MQTNPSRKKADARLPGVEGSQGLGDTLEVTALFAVLVVAMVLQVHTHMRTCQVCVLRVRRLLHVKYTSAEWSLTVRNVWRSLQVFSTVGHRFCFLRGARVPTAGMCWWKASREFVYLSSKVTVILFSTQLHLGPVPIWGMSVRSYYSHKIHIDGMWVSRHRHVYPCKS